MTLVLILAYDIGYDIGDYYPDDYRSISALNDTIVTSLIILLIITVPINNSSDRISDQHLKNFGIKH